jgi:hypothetical protein
MWEHEYKMCCATWGWAGVSDAIVDRKCEAMRSVQESCLRLHGSPSKSSKLLQQCVSKIWDMGPFWNN